MKLDRKGYTLIELLAVIIIIGLIIGFSTYGIIKSLNSSKETALVLSEKSIKEAAQTYATEKSDDSDYWLDIANKENKYFCTTIEELMNKGLLDKKAESTKFKKSDFVLVKKNKATFVNSNAEILLDNTSEDFNICSGNIVNEDIKKYPMLKNGTSYTDEIHVPFTDAETNPSSTITDKVCMYGDSTANMKKTATIEGNTCKLQGLKDNTIYYLKVCMTTEKGSYICSVPESRSTVRVKKPTYTSSGNTLTIKYDDTGITGEAKYYFKSTANGTSNSSVKKCTLDNNIFTCSGTTTNIEKDTWYQSSNKNINISYSEGTVKITARTVDKSNNYNESTKSVTINKYTITFIKEPADKIGGGTINITKSCYAISGQNCSITSPTIERKGYSIVGWNTTKDATKSTWNANTSKNISSSATYYPITKAYIVTIKFSTNNGSLTSPTVTTANNTYKWRENNSIIERTNANGSTYSTLAFKLKYNAELPTDGLPNYNYSKYLKITKTGYSAVSKEEWKCKSGCTTSGKTYDQTVIYKASDFCDATNKDCTVVLGVNWKINTYTITYNANGGKESNQTQKVNYGETWTTKDKIFTKEGYTQIGWNTKADGSGTTYSLKKLQNAKKEGNLTLYAKWQVNTYTITYNANGGKESNQTQKVNYGETWTTKDKIFTKEGYTQIGWNTKADGSGTTYSLKKLQNAKKEGNLTLYAKWQSNAYKITLNNQSATTAGTKEVYYQYNTTKTINGTLCYYYTNSTLTSCLSSGYNIVKPTKTGYSFQGYYTGTNGTGTNYVNSSGKFINNIYKTTGNRELYAKWQANTYTATFDPLGGKASFTSKQVKYDSAYGNLPTATKTGYTLVGWTAKNIFYSKNILDYNNLSYSSGVFKQASADTRTDLQWKIQGFNGDSFVKNLTTTKTQNTGTVSLTFTKDSSFNNLRFGLNGAKIDTLVKFDGSKLTNGKTYTISAKITNSSQGSVSWTNLQLEEGKTATVYQTHVINSSTKVTTNGSHTLYAVWQANTYSITYNANGGTGAPSKQTYTYSTSGTINLSSTKPTKTGYTFLGWSLSSTASSASYTAGQKWRRDNNDDYILYAVWQKKVCDKNKHVWKARGIKIISESFSWKCWCNNYHTRSYIIYCSECGMSALYYSEHYGEPGPTLMCPDKPYNPNDGTGQITKVVDDCSLSDYTAAKNISGGTNSFKSTTKRSC